MSFSPQIVPALSILDVWADYCNARGLTPEILDVMGGQLMTLEAAAKVDGIGQGIQGFKSIGVLGAFVFPLAKGALQARLILGPPPEVPKVGAALRKAPKYFRPKNCTNVLYVPPHLNDWYGEQPYNLLIVEGALNAARLASEGVHAVGITGVFNYRIGNKTSAIIPELVNLVRAKQVDRITIMFDSDTGESEDKRTLWNGIHNLSQDLVKLRSERRDTIYICRPPSRINGEKNGPDDYLHSVGLEEFLKLLREQSERYADNPYLVAEGTALSRYIFEEFSGWWYDTKQRISLKTDHLDRILATYGFMDDILSNRPMRTQYNNKRLLSAPGLRIAGGIRYQPDTDEIFFHDDNEEPPKSYINTFQPEDVPQALKGDVSIFYEMLNLLCCNTPSAVPKILSVLAMHAQNPALTPKYGLVFLGEKGTGKSTMARLIGHSLSKRFTDVKVKLDESFNSTWRGFACKEWAEFDRNMDEEWLKDLITATSYEVNTKYGRQYTEYNHTLNIFTTNTARSKIQEGDRRFIICGNPKPTNKTLGLQFEAWEKGMGPNHLRYHLLNDISCSDYDLIDVYTEMTEVVVGASRSYRATVKDQILEELVLIPGLECIPNTILEILLEPHDVKPISFNHEFGQEFIMPKLRLIKINGHPERFRAFTNHEKWLNEGDPAEYRKQYTLAEQLLKREKYDG